MQTAVFLQTTGGVMEPDYDETKTIKKRSGGILKDLLERRLSETEVVRPVKGLQRRMDEYGPERMFIENVFTAISQVNYQARIHPHLVSYSLPESFTSYRDRGFTHFLFYSAVGAVASTGRTVAAVQQTILAALFGGIHVPVLDYGLGSVVLVNLRKNDVRFVNRITDPRTFTVTDRDELKSLFRELLEPYFEELRAGETSS